MTEHWVDADSTGGDGSQGSPWSPTDLAGLTIVAGDTYHMNGEFISPLNMGTGDGTGTIFTNTISGVPFRLHGFSGTVARQVAMLNMITIGASTFEAYSYQYCYVGFANVYGNLVQDCTLWGISGYFNISPLAPSSVTVSKSILWGLNYKGKGPLYGTGSQSILVKDCVSHLSGVINGGATITLNPSSDPLTIVPRPSGYPDISSTDYTVFNLVPGYGVGAIGGWAVPYVPPTPTPTNASTRKPSAPKNRSIDLKIREAYNSVVKRSEPVQQPQTGPVDIRKIRRPF